MSWREINFDGLVGPTHNYAGLAFGNLASSRNRDAISNPRAAALEGLEKMRLLMDLGVPQAVLPPLPRPDIDTLRRLGFAGTDQQVLDAVWKTAPDLFTACCSASSMWTANAATVAPSCDTLDGRLHLTPANLVTNFHRSIEAQPTTALLRRIFTNEQLFAVHDPLPPFAGFADEGAANHMRLGAPGKPGVHVLVYGTGDHLQSPTQRFPARQTLRACQAIARLNQLPAARVLYWQQHPDAIDAGAFHNDVVAVSHHHHLFCHEQAFVDQANVLAQLQDKMSDQPLQILQVKAADIPLDMAVSTYLFNSQIVTAFDGSTCMILPAECEDNVQVKQYVAERIVGSGFVQKALYVDVRQSMRNGGGPACLRLRVVLSSDQAARLENRVIINRETIEKLRQLIQAEYPVHMDVTFLRDAETVTHLNHVVGRVYRMLGIPVDF